MKKIKLALIFLSLCFQTAQGFAETQLIAWTAANIGGTPITNFDVEKYIEDTLLNDRIKAALFAKAGNYRQYQADKRDWLQKHFEMGLKKMVYARIIQKEAMRKKVNGKRVAFTTTEEDYFSAIRKIESNVLDPVMERDKQGIRAARKKYAEFLRSSNYPYKEGESLTDTYFRWYDGEKDRLKEQFRSQGVKQWQAYKGTKGRELYVRPTDMFDFHKSVVPIIEENLNGKSLSQQEVREMMGQDKRLGVLIKDIHYLNFQSSPLYEFYTQDKENWEDTKNEIVRALSKALTNDKINKILRYENLTQKFIKKYETSEKLYEKSRKALEKFQSPGGDFNDFMLARIYSLAATALEKKPNRKEIRQTVAQALSKVFPALIQKLSEDEVYTSKVHQKLNLERLLSTVSYNEFKTHVKLSEDKEDYLRKFVDLAVWVIKFEGKRLALGDKSEIKVEIHPINTYKTQKRISDYLKMQEFERNLESYHQDRSYGGLREFWEGLVRFNIDGKTILQGREAYNYLFSDKSAKQIQQLRSVSQYPTSTIGVFNFYNDGLKVIQEKLEGKNLTKSKVDEILNADYRLPLIIKDINSNPERGIQVELLPYNNRETQKKIFDFIRANS